MKRIIASLLSGDLLKDLDRKAAKEAKLVAAPAKGNRIDAIMAKLDRDLQPRRLNLNGR